MKNKRIFSTIAIVVILAMVLVGGYSYFTDYQIVKLKAQGGVSLELTAGEGVSAVTQELSPNAPAGSPAIQRFLDRNRVWYKAETPVLLKAELKEGYSFKGWFNSDDALVSANQNFEYTVKGYAELTAVGEDSSIPVVSISDPSSGNAANPVYTNKTTYTVTGTASDEGSGIEKIVVNGVEATVNKDGSWSADIPLSNNAATVVTAVVADKAGNTATDTKYLYCDVTNPELAVDAPASTNKTKVTVTGTAKDHNGIKSVTVNGKAVEVKADGSWTAEVDVPSKDTTITVVTTDNAGNTTTVTKTILFSYSITYELNGGSVTTANPESYTSQSEDIILNNPTKTGYTFNGWTGSNGTTPQTSVTIAKGSTGNKTYTANWTPLLHALIYNDGTMVFQRGPETDATHGTLVASYTGFENERYSTSSSLPPWYGNATSVKSVVFKDTVQPTYTSYWFYGMSNCTSMDLAKLDTTKTLNANSMFKDCSALTSLDLSKFVTTKVTRMDSMFYNCSGLTTLDVSGFDTYNAMDFFGMFYNCSGLTTLDVSGFDTRKVKNMANMFYNCSGLTTLDVSGFDTSNVTNTEAMFYGCSGLTTLDVSGFDTRNVTNMNEMFYGCSGLTTLDVSGFDTRKVKNMTSMFYKCSGLTALDVSGFDTRNVTAICGMFNCCSNITELDLSNFVFSQEIAMSWMFQNCESLKTIYVSDAWDVSLIIESVDMFNNCPSIVGGAGTTVNWHYIDETYARIDGKDGLPGYLTNCITLSYENVEVGSTVNPAVTIKSKVFSESSDRRYEIISGGDYASVDPSTGVITGEAAGMATVKVTVTAPSGATSSAQATVKIIEYAITYDPNGGTMPENPDTSYNSKEETLLPVPTKLGYEFKGWKDKNDPDSDPITTLPKGETGDKEFIAEWSAITYTVKFDKNGGSGTMADLAMTYDSAKNLTANAFSKTGYTFNGWNTKADGTGTSYTNKAEVKNLSAEGGAAVTLYAQWKLNTYSITYNLNGGTNPSGAVTSYNVTTVAFNLPTPTRAGYAFAGWTGSNGTTPQTSVTIAKGSTGNKTYTANWTPLLHALIYNDGTMVFQIGPETDASHGTLLASYTGFENTAYSSGNLPPWSGNATSVKSVVFKDTVQPITTTYWFYGMSNCTSMDLAKLDTTNVTLMNSMFRDCSALTSLDLSKFVTTKVTRMDYMFSGCSGLSSLDLSGFNTSKVHLMNSMFSCCTRLSALDLSSFNTRNVTYMIQMFLACSNLTSLDLSTFDTSNVTNMQSMFEACSKLTILDLSNFNTSKVTDMRWMFQLNDSLKTIYVSDFWNVSAVTSSVNMFYDCRSIVGGAGTTYSISNERDKTYARIDGKDGLPGYLTYKAMPVDSGSAQSLIVANFELPESMIAGEEQAISSMPDVPALNAAATAAAPENTVLYGWLVDSGMAKEIVLLEDFEDILHSVYDEVPDWAMTITPLYKAVKEDVKDTEATEPSEPSATEPADGKQTISGTANTTEYTITYVLDGGKLPESGVVITFAAGDNVTLPTPIKDGYEFKGWFENADFSGDAVTDFVGGEANKTFYAKWEAVTKEDPAEPSNGAGSTDDTAGTEPPADPSESATEPSETPTTPTEPAATEPTVTEPVETQPVSSEPTQPETQESSEPESETDVETTDGTTPGQEEGTEGAE